MTTPSICVIFDIDGTLVDSDEFEGRLYWSAIREVLGDVRIREQWHTYEHVSDTGILKAVCHDNHLEFDGLGHRVRTRFGELVSAHIGEANPCVAMPGAPAFWEQLRAHSAFKIGIATGGWGHTARMKLDAAGYDYSGVPIATSDDHHERIRIMERCRAMISASIPTIYFGDGEWDKVACDRLGWRFIGVGPRLQQKCSEWIAHFHLDHLIDRLLLPIPL